MITSVNACRSPGCHFSGLALFVPWCRQLTTYRGFQFPPHALPFEVKLPVPGSACLPLCIKFTPQALSRILLVLLNWDFERPLLCLCWFSLASGHSSFGALYTLLLHIPPIFQIRLGLYIPHCISYVWFLKPWLTGKLQSAATEDLPFLSCQQCSQLVIWNFRVLLPPAAASSDW